MAFTLWSLFEASLLVLNAVCVLHEERFLAKIGWGINRQNMQGFGEEPSVKLQILNLVRSIRTVARCRYTTVFKSKQQVFFNITKQNSFSTSFFIVAPITCGVLLIMIL